MSEVDRQEYIGGSDAAKLIGKHKFGGPKGVYEFLKGDVEFVDGEDLSENRHIMRGNAIEPHALDRIKERHPSINSDGVREMFDRGDGIGGEIFLQDPEYDFIGGHVDGLSQDPLDATLIVHEIKAPTSSSVDRIEKNGIPARYFYQVQHYMGILGMQTDLDIRCIVEIWSCDDWDINPIGVEYKPEIYEKLRPFYKDVWNAAVVEGYEFGETGLFDEVVYEGPDTIETTEEQAVTELIAEYHDVHTKYKESKERRKELKTKILSQVNDVEMIETPTHTAEIRDYKNSTYLKIREK